MPKISALLPVYNTKEEHLIECIESILNQTFKDFELIILNDGSTNNVEEIIKQYSDERIKYFKNEVNEGITKVRNKLLNMANGDYIAIVDHDDISFPYRFEKEYKIVNSNSGLIHGFHFRACYLNTLFKTKENKISFIELSDKEIREYMA